jgi:hypothetical protein
MHYGVSLGSQLWSNISANTSHAQKGVNPWVREQVELFDEKQTEFENLVTVSL